MTTLAPLHRPPRAQARHHQPLTSAPERIRGRKLQKERERLFAESPLCKHCYQKTPRVIREATQRDHEIPLAMGGLDIPSNTQALCDECHAVKTKDDLRRIAQSKASGGKVAPRLVEPVIA